MTLKTIYIARHGYRSNWLPPPHPPAPTGIDSDPPLLEHGEHQAVELAHYILSLMDSTPQMIISSPFYRCLQTSEPISKVLELPVLVERGIGEWFKLERPTHPVPADIELLSKFFDNLDKNYNINGELSVVPALNGESEQDIFDRCKLFWQKFIPFMEQNYPQVERVLLVTHALTKIALGMSLLEYQSPRDLLKPVHVINGEIRLRAGACSLDRYDYDDNNNNWSLTMNGNVEFLTEGEEMNWNFEHGFEAGSDEDIKARQERISRDATADLEDQFDEVYITIDIPGGQQIASQSGSNSQYYNRGLIEELSKSNSTTNKDLNLTSGTNNNDMSKSTGFSQLSNLYNSSSLQFSGLETKDPFFLINQQLYQGEYRKLNGTELILNDDAEVVAMTRDRILLHKGDFTTRVKGNDRSKQESVVVSNNDDVEEDAEEEAEDQNELNSEKQALAKIPEGMKRTNNPFLLEKLIEAKRLELERTVK